MKRYARRILGLLGTIAFTAWAAIKFILDWVGRSTFVEDASALYASLPSAIGWIENTSAWLPTFLALMFTAFVFWLSRPEVAAPAQSAAKAQVAKKIGRNLPARTSDNAGPLAGIGGEHLLVSGVRLSGVEGDDWYDVAAAVDFRNRHTEALNVKLTSAYFDINGATQKPVPRSNISTPIASGATAALNFGKVRLYEVRPGDTGLIEASLTFWPGSELAVKRSVLVKIRLELATIPKGTTQNPVQVKSDKFTKYSATEDES